MLLRPYGGQSFKFPGRQKIAVSKKWGFTKWSQEDYREMVADGRLQPNGITCQYFPNKGPFARWVKIQEKPRNDD
ncbi:60S ribosomal protein L10-like [Oppia nitens]|uniref:60S ribosomal protein L10-like n=1 Tax=Oppia nitens TaxID=1686743 RepID=UPI0023DA3A02|nr:60S ribosomal protein L10-like [Oppia nitens]